jgi:hypothetical protein
MNARKYDLFGHYSSSNPFSEPLLRISASAY